MKDEKHLRRRMNAGFTLVEVQVAMIVMLVVLFMLGGHHRVYNQLLASVTVDRKVDGYFDFDKERAFLTMAETGSAAAPPACDVRVDSVNYSGSYPRVYVVVEESDF